ncbi:ferritin-like domain-containing protein [Phytohabitans houttuyneae]|nr:DUF2202 domain-containing protein [Phytohabitans houttuyneae]
MKKITYAATAALAAGVLGAGALSTLSPVWAAPGPAGAAVTTPTPGYGPGGPGAGMGPGWDGNGPGAGMRAGMGAGGGACPLGADVASGTLTAAQRTTLAAMAEEEKLAHDLYQVFADQYDAVVFERIAAAETRHLATVRMLLDRYGINDPTVGLALGQFAAADVQATYEAYLRDGNASLSAALGVGEKVERADIAALEKAQDGLAAADVELVYQHLLMASQHHLAAFTR